MSMFTNVFGLIYYSYDFCVCLIYKRGISKKLLMDNKRIYIYIIRENLKEWNIIYNYCVHIYIRGYAPYIAYTTMYTLGEQSNYRF